MESLGGEAILEHRFIADIQDVILSFLTEPDHDEIKIRIILVNYNLREVNINVPIHAGCTQIELEDLSQYYTHLSNNYKRIETTESASMDMASLTTLRQRYNILDAVAANLQKIHRIRNISIPMEID